MATAESTVLEISTRLVAKLREELSSRDGAPIPSEGLRELEVIEVPRTKERPPLPEVERDYTIDLTSLLRGMSGLGTGPAILEDAPAEDAVALDAPWTHESCDRHVGGWPYLHLFHHYLAV